MNGIPFNCKDRMGTDFIVRKTLKGNKIGWGMHWASTHNSDYNFPMILTIQG